MCGRRSRISASMTEACRRLGIRLYKPGLIWPMDRERLVDFAQSSTAVLVVEEKRPVMEDQIARHLYAIAADRRPALAGKQDLQGAPLLSGQRRAHRRPHSQGDHDAAGSDRHRGRARSTRRSRCIASLETRAQSRAARRSGPRTSAPAVRTTRARTFPMARSRSAASVVTDSSPSSWIATRCSSCRWDMKARRGSRSVSSSIRRTCSRTWAMARTRTRASSRFAPPSPRKRT